MYRLPDLSRLAARRLADERGFGIIEVLVSAVLVVVLTLGVLAAVDAAGRTADVNKARGAAANLATADQERLRSIPISELTNLDYTAPPKVVDNKSYTVRSQGAYVVGSGISAQCASSEAAPKYLKITSTVTWSNMKIKPVKQDSLRAMPNGTVAGRGSLAVDIDGRDGVGLPGGVSVTITGPQTVTGTTNANGCVIFGFIPAGNYTVSFGKTGHMEAKSPFRQNVSDPVTVAVDSTAGANYLYDAASSIRATYQTTSSAGSGTVGNTNGDGFTIGSASLGTPNFRLFPADAPHTVGQTFTGTQIFPYASYEVWAGRCMGARPTDNAQVVQAAMTPGQQTSVNLREPKISIQARRNTNANGSSSGAIPNNTPVVLRATGTGCSQVYTGTVQGGLATFDVPYGSYQVCLQWAAGSANRQTRTYTINSQAAAGQTFNITNDAASRVPYGTGTGVAGCPTT